MTRRTVSRFSSLSSIMRKPRTNPNIKGIMMTMSMNNRGYICSKGTTCSDIQGITSRVKMMMISGIRNAEYNNKRSRKMFLMSFSNNFLIFTNGYPPLSTICL